MSNKLPAFPPVPARDPGTEDERGREQLASAKPAPTAPGSSDPSASSANAQVAPIPTAASSAEAISRASSLKSAILVAPEIREPAINEQPVPRSIEPSLPAATWAWLRSPRSAWFVTGLAIGLVCGAALAVGFMRTGERRESTASDRQFIDFDVASLPQLGVGWSTAEQASSGDTLRWCAARVCTVTVQVQGSGPHRIRFRVAPWPYPGGPKQEAEVFVNGTRVGAPELLEGFNVITLRAPKEVWKPGRNELKFQFAYAERPADHTPGSTDIRTLAAFFDWLEVTKQ